MMHITGADRGGPGRGGGAVLHPGAWDVSGMSRNQYVDGYIIYGWGGSSVPWRVTVGLVV